MSELLISEVQKHPSLWNLNHPQCHNRFMSDRVWTSVADELKKTKENAKTKWRNLRDTFNREFKKISKPRSGSSAEDEPVYNGKWVHFSSMMFLKDVATPRETQSNLSNADFNETDETNMDVSLGEGTETQMTNVPLPSVLDNDNVQQQEAPKKSQKNKTTDQGCVTPDSVRPPKMRKKRTPMSEFEEQLFNEREKINALKEPEDDDLMFFKSLTPYFKQMTPLQKLKVRSKIQQGVVDELSVWPITSPASNSAGSTKGSNFQTYNFGPGHENFDAM